MFLDAWTYEGDDPGLKVFTAANPLLPAGGVRVYEIGASDTDWLERVAACDPSKSVGGVDWRIQKGRPLVEQGDVLTMDLPVADAFVGISSIEHVGLGHYEQDPVDPYGDVKAIQRLRDHLAPGGWMYFDVPYAPEGYWQKGTKCRIYDDPSLQQRFGPHTVLCYTNPSGTVIEKPVKNCGGDRPYWYVALLIHHG